MYTKFSRGATGEVWWKSQGKKSHLLLNREIQREQEVGPTIVQREGGREELRVVFPSQERILQKGPERSGDKKEHVQSLGG